MYSYHMSNLDRALSNVHCYQDSQRIRHDVESVLRQIPSLQPSHGPLTQNDGSTQTLLYLSGTIPIFYSGSQYNIPVEIWLLGAYPFEAPLSYVRPTNDMMIKPSHPQVTPEGLVVLPYLSTWNAQTHSLVELIAHECSAFGAIPPVFRKPPNMPIQQPAYQQAGSYQPQNSTMMDPRKKLTKDATAILQHELRKVYKKIQQEMDSQFEAQIHLSQGHDVVLKGIEELKGFEKELEDAISASIRKNQAIDEWLSKNRQEKATTIQVDEILLPADTWSRQMLDEMAAQQAIEDTLYHMDRALNNGEIELEIFLKEVRKLSRKQFMHVALMQRIVEQQSST